MENGVWCAALRQRLAMPRAECSQAQLAHAAPHCHLRSSSETVCGQELDTNGYHTLTDQRGGNILIRHERLNRALGGLVMRWRAVGALYNQRVPHWDRPSRRPGREGEIEHAELDLEYSDDDGRRWIDVSVRHPAAGDAAAVRKAVRRDGEAAQRGEKTKHERYPGDWLTPFVVEIPGRLVAEAGRLLT